MPLPELPTAADVLPKTVLLRLPLPASCLLLVSSGSEPEDDRGKPADGIGEDPNLKKVVVEDEVATAGIEEPLLLDPNMAEVIDVTLLPAEAAVALLPQLVARDELLNIS